MILLDSSAWFEILKDGPLAAKFIKYLSHKSEIIVSAVSIFEIYRKLAKQSEEAALSAIASLKQYPVIAVDENISLEAGEIAQKHALAMADSFILATAQLHEAELITKDNDFRNIPGCIIVS